jgi:hypothetical protein
MYLIIDEQYRIFQSPIMSGYVRAQAKAGKLSVVNLLQMKGINLDGSWSAIQTLPDDFQIDEPGEF